MSKISAVGAAVAALLMIVGVGAASAQTATSQDLARVEAQVNVVSQQVTAAKKTDPTLATQSEKTLQEIQDDLTYLKVKLRREGNVTQKEVKDLADRVETLRVRLESNTVRAQPILGDEVVDKVVTLPVGTEFEVRLQTSLSSATAKVEQRFEATTIEDVRYANELVIPAGSVARGFVSSVSPAGRLNRKGSITLSFDEMIVNGKRPPLRASLVKAMEGKSGQDATRIGAGAVVGGIIGGMLGGGKGALAGVLIGGGGTIAATDGADAELPAGTVLRIRLDQPLEVTIK
jgi:hypothetical protein